MLTWVCYDYVALNEELVRGNYLLIRHASEQVINISLVHYYFWISRLSVSRELLKITEFIYIYILAAILVYQDNETAAIKLVS